jgi:hypothetical protein
MTLFKEYLKAPWKNKIAVIVVISQFPIVELADLFSWISDKLYDLVNFMQRWMEFWTGLR